MQYATAVHSLEKLWLCSVQSIVFKIRQETILKVGWLGT